MSPNVGNFVHDLVEMAKATERLPEVERDNHRLLEQHHADGHHIARLEQRIHELKQEQDALHAKLRSVEAERDDAGFRMLEAEEARDAILTALKTVQSHVGETLKTVLPAQPDPLPSPDPVAVDAPVDPSTAPVATPPSADVPISAPGSATDTTTTVSTSPEPVGQSDSGPTVSSDGTSPPASSQSVPSVEPASFYHSTPSTPQGPYVGKRYADHPYYVSLQGWLAGGGTEDDYNYPYGGMNKSIA